MIFHWLGTVLHQFRLSSFEVGFPVHPALSRTIRANKPTEQIVPIKKVDVPPIMRPENPSMLTATHSKERALSFTRSPLRVYSTCARASMNICIMTRDLKIPHMKHEDTSPGGLDYSQSN